MIEFVFAASPETIRREPQEITLHRSVGDLQDLAACALCNPVVFSLEGAVYATAVLKFSIGTNGRCPRSTASRYVTILRATAMVARFVFPFCLAFSYTKESSWLFLGASLAASTRTR